MPLSPIAIYREIIHCRKVKCTGYRREDGLWDIEGRLLDTKAYDFAAEDNEVVTSGTPIHDLKIRMTVTDRLEVTAIEACIDSSPFPGTCPHIAKKYEEVVGMKIGPGWTRSLKEKFEGPNGCTHMTELLGPMATTAFQTIVPFLARERAQRASGNLAIGMKPHAKALLNTCHTFRVDGPIAKRFFPNEPTEAE